MADQHRMTLPVLGLALSAVLTGCDLVNPEPEPVIGINERHEAWTEWISENVLDLGSPATVEPSDFEFLRPLLEGRRIVQVGALASAHVSPPGFSLGHTEHFQLATRLIPFLHEELGFDVFLCGGCGPFETYWAGQHVDELNTGQFYRVIADEWF